ncbi:hypothetical protein M413DRAFT_445173 [Hebeloma cylindrosporum]|uniref:Potassium transporter n=1 Tax=Hebeloma cylindrosporum TaxID=76867 RepID=A4H1L2_HEBCY|nr:hypothetical protein M413DRAFT_445173 [Hebeloma cylindrosporum h7]CAL36606.1 potassium transporter [Hebeloma cylindrosporum]
MVDQPADLEDGASSWRQGPAGRITFSRIIDFITEEVTFFRIHIAAFTFIPLIFSCIFYASNGRFHVSFLDSMFLCYSAMTVTGLSTVNLSTITPWQQAILYTLMTIGDFTVVSWIMVLIRKRFFRTHCEYIVLKDAKQRTNKSKASIKKTISSPIATFKQREAAPRQEKEPIGPTTETHNSEPQVHFVGPTPGVTLSSIPTHGHDPANLGGETHIISDEAFSSSPKSEEIPLTTMSEPVPVSSPMAVEFALSTTIPPRFAHYHPMMTMRNGRAVPKRGATMLSASRVPDVPGAPNTNNAKYQGFGGFPGPTKLLTQVVKITAPQTYQKLERSMTITTMTTLHASSAPWLNFSGLVVGRNSDFRTDSLTDEQLEDIGGAEYKALRLLSYLVPAYIVGTQLIAVLLFLPWLYVTKSYDEVFAAQPRLVSKAWFSFFQVMGAFTGGGLSLVDASMVPFQGAYLMIVALMFMILAGNFALPIFLRFIIWIASRILPEESDAQEALSFLLHHPRRCFLYLFPSHQTWFLVICLVVFSAMEWTGFAVLNLGLPAYESIPKGPRIIAGLFQGLAARASGLAIVPVASLAPALQFLYVVMMYIAVYPVALSIRSTNVYEERSLGVFEVPPIDENEEPNDVNSLVSRKERVGRYLGWHLRRQMSMDIWWLVWAIFIVAIIERKNILDDSKKWFDLFRILFELVSAFGGIGLSLGFPSDNFSFSGAMHPLSKLVIIVIMVRGRHRGLPVAVDRAVLLPSELVISNASGNGVTMNDNSEALKSGDIYDDKRPHSPNLPPLRI